MKSLQTVSKTKKLLLSLVSFAAMTHVTRAQIGGCLIIPYNNQINALTDYEVTFTPTAAATYTETSFKVYFPADLGIVTTASFACAARFNTGFQPITSGGTVPCTWTTTTVLSVDYSVLTVSSLSTGSELNYSLLMKNVDNGPVSGLYDGVYCESYNGATKLETKTASSSIEYSAINKVSGVNTVATSLVNGASTSLTMTFNVDAPVPVGGSIKLCLPFSDELYQSLSLTDQSPTAMISSLSPTVTVSYSSSGGSISLGTLTKVVTTEGDKTCAGIQFSNTQILPAGGVITMSLSPLKNPPVEGVWTGIEAWTGDGSFTPIEYATFPTISTSIAGTATGTVTIDPLKTEVDLTNVQYTFQVTLANPIPQTGFFTLTVPSSVGVGSDPQNTFSFACVSGCVTSSATLQYDSATRTFTISGAFPTTSDFLVAPGPLKFTLTGFTNSATSSAAVFSWADFVAISGVTKKIDTTTMSATPTDPVVPPTPEVDQGVCQIRVIKPTDNNLIYGIPGNYTITAWCDHDITSTDTLKIVFPSAYTVVENNRCILGGLQVQYSYYNCIADADDNSITLVRMTTDKIPYHEWFTFTIDSIINPGTYDDTGSISVTSYDSNSNIIDVGSYTITKGYFVKGNITVFTVVPLDVGVGQFPATYRFTVTPSGEVWEDAYITIKLPDQVSIWDQRALETKCGTNLQAFTYVNINCKVNGNVITINNGFMQEPTRNLTDTDVDDIVSPPTLKFDLTQFLNPRSTSPTDNFNVTIYTKAGKEIYTWDIDYAPNITMKDPATSQKVVLMRVSEQNGNITNYTFSVTTTNRLYNGDRIRIRLPSPASFSEKTTVYGRSANVKSSFKTDLSADLTYLTFTLTTPIKARMLAAQNVIQAGETYMFMLTEVKNPFSYRPTALPVIYEVYDSLNDFGLIERYSKGLELTNKIVGDLLLHKNGFVPSDWNTSANSNYTMQLSPVNYEQNMQVKVTLPEEVNFDSSNPKCYIASGAQADIEVSCTADRLRKTLTFTNAFSTIRSNPGTMTIVISKLKNPTQNKVTSSFGIQTYTKDNYPLDALMNNMTLNFFCAFPCASCSVDDQNLCYSCYSAVPQRFWQDYKCLKGCPSGFVEETDRNNCTSCEWPCSTCDKSPDSCTACVPGYNLFKNKPACYEVVYWPFPFVFTGIIFFILVCCSECFTKRQSRFKEAIVALVSLPEAAAWGTLFGFYYFKIGPAVSTLLAAGAIALYILLNFIHMIVHPRKMIPKTLATYQQILKTHRCSTGTINVLAYLVSFKFSLLPVSYLFLKPKFKGDYSPENWHQFNRFSLSFLFLPYPLMMAACALFWITEGIFSWAGYVTLEVIALSTFLAIIQWADVCHNIDCKTVGKKKSSIAVKVATGADFESDDDESKRKRALRKTKNDQEEFGDSYASELDGLKVTSGHNDDTKQQIMLLEELAEKMRLEKEQLRLEKERIELERLQMQNSKDDELSRMEQYLADYNNYTNDLTRQLRHLEGEKNSMAREFEDQMKKKGKYRDIEREMEDTEPFEKTMDAVQLPVDPAYGELDYERQEDGEDVVWISILTPRQGEQSPRYDHNFDASANTVFFRANNRPEAVFEQFGGRTREMSDNRKFIVRADNQFDDLTPREIGDDSRSEFFKQNEDAYHEQDLGVREVGDKEYWVNRDGAYFSDNDLEYSDLSARGAAGKGRGRPGKYERDEAHNFIMAKPNPVYESDPKSSRFASQFEYLGHKNAAVAGQDTHRPSDRQMEASQRYFRQEDAEYGDLASEGKLERQATPHQYRAPLDSARGQEEHNHSMSGSEMVYFKAPERFIHDDKSGDLSDPYQYHREGSTSMRFMNPPGADGGVLSDRRSIGSQEIFQHRDNAVFSPTGYRAGGEFGSASNPSQMMEKDHVYFAKPGAEYNKEDSRSIDGNSFVAYRKHEAARGDISTRPDLQGEQNYFRPTNGEVGRPDDHTRSYHGTSHQFMNRNGSRKGQFGEVSPGRNFDTASQNYMHRQEAEMGRGTMNYRTGTHNYIAQPDHGYQGYADDYLREADYEGEFEPNRDYHSVDESGRSVSSEGVIADHNPFNSIQEALQHKLVNMVGQKSQDMLQREMPPAERIRPPMSSQKNRKTILYSDKSESSVDEMMGDTPSNYNIPNMRLDGKSLGLKAILLHAQKNGNELPIDMKLPGGLSSIPEHQRFASNPANLNRSGDESLDGRWSTLQQPLHGNNTVLAGDEDAHQRKKKTVRTNKTFAEAPMIATGPEQRSSSNGRGFASLGSSKDKKNKLMKNNFV